MMAAKINSCCSFKGFRKITATSDRKEYIIEIHAEKNKFEETITTFWIYEEEYIHKTLVDSVKKELNEVQLVEYLEEKLDELISKYENIMKYIPTYQRYNNFLYLYKRRGE